MKYLYFDCFAGFTPAMAAGALMDMTSDEEIAKRIIRSQSGASFSCREVKRNSMEAVLFDAVVPECGRAVKSDELISVTDSFDVSDSTKRQLAEFVRIKAEARSINPDDALFDFDMHVPSLIAAAYVFESLASLKVKKVTVSSVLCSDATVFSGTQFLPVTKAETLYILKKYSIAHTMSPVTSELISEDGAAMLAVLGAGFCASPLGNIIKIGYGAGAQELTDMPNIVRVVYGHEDDGAMLFEAERAFEDVFTEFASMEN